MTTPDSLPATPADTAAPALAPAFKELAAKVLAALEGHDTRQALHRLEMMRDLAGADEPVAAGLIYHLTALVSLRLEEIGKTLGAFEAAHRHAPDTRQHIEALAIMNARLGRVVEALYHGKLSAAASRRLDIAGLLPAWMGSFEAYFYRLEDEPVRKLADRAALVCDWTTAEKFYRQSVELNERDTAAWRGLAEARRHLDQPYGALDALLALHKLAPANPGDIAALGLTMAQLGEWEQAADCCRHAAGLAKDGADFAWAPVRLLFDWPAHNRRVDGEAAIAAAVAQWAASRPASPQPARPLPDNAGNRRLRLGILSRRWGDHDGLTTILPMLMAMPRQSTELHVYADGAARTTLGRRLRGAATSWMEIAELDDETLSLILKNEGLDILIDLDGPLYRGRRDVFLSHPVGLQVSLGDLAATAGKCGFDAVLGDRWSHAESDAPGVPVLRVDGVGAALPTDLALLTPPISRQGAIDGRIVLGCAAGPGRIGRPAAALWADLLRGDARLGLHLPIDRLGGPNSAQAVLELFKALDLGDRLSFAPEGTDWYDYLAGVDVLLDPPGNVRIEAAVAAVAAGIPVVTLEGRLPASRVLGGWLRLIGAAGLVASDEPEYLAAARAAAAPAGMMARRLSLMASVAQDRTEGTRRRALALEAALRAGLAAPSAPMPIAGKVPS